MIVLGLSSGTSVDAIDAAAADLTLGDDGVLRMRPLGHTEYAWPRALRERILKALPPAAVDVAEVAQLDTLIGQELGRAGRRAIDDVAGGDVDLVASHGQTIYHWVVGARARGTLQLGNAAWVAEHVKRPVISDFRVADVAAGGHGAPLVSVLDALWLGREDGGADGTADAGLTAALNIGGIANVSLVGRVDDPVTGWDTGPGNCLLDVAVAALTDGRLAYDKDGELAAQGTVDPVALAALLDDPYFAAPAPKSTGRELFDTTYTARRLASVRPGLTGPDLVATLTELTAVSVADALAGRDVRRVVASGGGARNPVLLDRLRATLAERVPHACEVVTSEALGLPVDAKEAYLFALLGFLSAHGLPGTAAGEHRRRATGARRAVVLGSLTPPTPLPWPAASGPVRRLALANTPHGLHPGPRTQGPLPDPTKGTSR
ncbi:anhydro-N-acetylmuramic acid kinase [Cellulosimicrobium cellulans]|uniref:anhydro-N-acetylmuramic acid kinase n=1 Tax=Cellulosimicrobium cellulans TaxID=1710 RepID=UPI00188402B5|nr:anhydro-N-acetylmuramic acid kinase [Cellulosimicrobium cellulans]MBE9927130.1 anhydro-N-acetylmuramic acid kinase [Cellulosimicrobium cellulans]